MAILKHVDFEVPAFGEIAGGVHEKPGYQSLVLADEPEIYWRLGEVDGSVAADETGNIDGSYAGNPAMGVTGALFRESNGAVHFNGTNQEVVTSSGVFDGQFDELTVEFWILCSAAGQVIVTEYPGNGQDSSLLIGISGAGYIAVSVDLVALDVADSLVPVTDDQWHHVAVTQDSSGQWRVYVDGQSQVIGTNSNRIGGAAFRAGGFGGIAYFNGSLDEVALYGKALSEAQIKAHFDAGAGR